MEDVDIFRREVLSGIGAAGLGALTVGTGSAAAETSEYNVGTASPAAEQAARDAADNVIRVLDWDGDKKTVTGTFSDEAINKLDNRPDVRYTEINGTYHAISETLPWGIDRVDAEVAHDSGETGGDDTDGEGGAHVTIIDTGVDHNHEDLNGNYVDGYDFVNDDDDPMDNHGHGTHVAGTADAIDDSEDVVGVSTEANLHAAKVLDSDGSGTWSDVAAGIRWTANQGHDVGNMSLGGTSPSSTVEDACQYAYDNGVLLVAAAGNDGRNRVSYPARYDTVVAVSAMNENDELAWFSNTGDAVEFIAPGVDVLSTKLDGGTTTMSGTSMASPHVAGAGGQLMDNDDTNAEARSRLQSTAEDIGLSSDEQGNGLVDVAAALGLDSSDDLGGSNSSPTVDSLSATEVETSDSDAEFDVDWSVSDSDGNLSSVDLTLTDDTDGGTEDTASISVSGDTASGTTRLVADGDDGSGNSYTVEAVVTDTDGASDSATTSVSETEDTSGGNAPTVDSLSLSEDNSGGSPHADFDASWSVSDSDGDLDTVDLTLTDTDTGATEDSASVDVSGSDASGTTDLKAKFDENNTHTYEVELVVTDSNGNSASDTATEVEDGS